jgi:signal transduction histidine kinase
MRPKILIVDDLLENLISLEAIFEDFEIDLVRAFSGEEALKHSLKDDYALVILDVQMPGMNGYETLEIMRQRKKTKYVPVIFVSAIHHSYQNIIKGIETGAVDFIPKPIVPEILKGKVRVFIDLYLQQKKLSSLLTEMAEITRNLEIEKQKAVLTSQSKSTFLAHMTHEIRSPLNGVIGLSRLLHKTPLNTDQQELLDIIISSGENLVQIINDLLDLSKIESGQIHLEQIDFNLNDLLNKIFLMMKYKAKENGIAFRYRLSPEIPSILSGDPLRITQVLTNLVNNALKFTSQGSVEFIVEQINRDQDDLQVLFKVKDTGIGISDHGKSLLFKEFSQTEKTIARQYGGTGLGLAISKNLVGLMKGQIGVRSELNEGSEFWFMLPLKSAEPKIPEILKQVEEAPLHLKILVAEDNMISQKVAKLTLKHLGFDCDVAQNGMEAYNMFIKGDYHLVLMDIQMPELDGLQSTAIIRAFERDELKGLSAYIVAVTANAMIEDKERCLLAGMDSFMSKPFTDLDLGHILTKAGKRFKEVQARS